MRLKSLEIHGYKSFANKVQIVFDGGLTAVVGPNGSGKSNVVDAIRWVLGETSAKALRGDEMADVLWVLICLANQTGVDLTQALEKNFAKKSMRDAERHKNNEKLG